MNNSEAINKLLYEHENLSLSQIKSYCLNLPRKIIRWIGINHPDNRTRKIFYELTGVEIGEGTVINMNFVVLDNYENLLKIGKNAAISPNVTVICDSNPNNSSLNNQSYVKDNLIKKLPVNIGDNVWIGAGVIILPGISIGEGSVIGAGSVVTKSVPSNVISAGIPSKIIRKL
jgi:acetyltransferase-like isoleucine patch superfamily enzyme